MTTSPFTLIQGPYSCSSPLWWLVLLWSELEPYLDFCSISNCVFTLSCLCSSICLHEKPSRRGQSSCVWEQRCNGCRTSNRDDWKPGSPTSHTLPIKFICTSRKIRATFPSSSPLQHLQFSPTAVMIINSIDVHWLCMSDKAVIGYFTESIVDVRIFKTNSPVKESLDIWQHCHLYSQLATLDLPTSGGPN